MIKQFYKIKPDVTHSTNSGAHRIGSVVNIFLYFTPFITIHGSEIHEFFENKKNNFFKAILIFHLLKCYLYKAKGIICVSNSTKKLLLPKLSSKENNLKVVYNGVNFKNYMKIQKSQIDTLREHLQIDEDSSILLSVSRLDEEKGNDVVLKSLCIVKNKFPYIKYLIVGDGPYKKKLTEIADEYNLIKNVIFVGKVDHYKIAPYYGLADIFILPSRRGEKESFGLVYIEAYCNKIPVIGPTHGGVPEVIEDGVTGYTVNPENYEEIADKIILLLSDYNLAKKMGEEGYKLAMHKFNSDRMSSETLKIYKKSLDN